MNKDWQHAYVATFPRTTMDESVYARKVTDHLGIKSSYVEIDPVKAIDKLDDFIYLFEDVSVSSDGIHGPFCCGTVKVIDYSS